MKKVLSKIEYFVGHPIVKYYIRHPIVLIHNRIIIFFLWFKKVVNCDINFNNKINSDVPIDVVIPAVDKDADVLKYVIDSIRKNVRHPIGDIVIVSPKSEIIMDLCKAKECIFVDEKTVLPITKKDINYTVRGENRSGWLFQQLLKWSGDKYVKNDYFLIADADTIFCRPQVFIDKEKVILPVNSQLCHIPYFEVYRKLTGDEIKPLVNFTSHHSLFQKNKLAAVKKKIEEQCGVQWYSAIINNIDINEGSFVSDYETYGQFVYQNYPKEFILEHWFNLSLSRKNLDNLLELVNKCGLDYKSISFHSYK